MMKENFNNLTRGLLVLCGLTLIVVLFVPLWSIDLVAPQYPEGLILLIYPHKLGGNVEIINGLNHYIGMKTLHTDDFFEFKILPYIIALFSLLFLLTALLRKRKWLNVLFVLFVCFGIIAMYDFWRWEYNYGHNLDPKAAIIVPGMAYQPPLIGFKQLLNFGAYSMPDIGGWIFIGTGVIILFCVIMEWKRVKKQQAPIIVTSIFLISILSSCTVKSDPIKLGVDHCHYCKMTISNARFGAEILTKKGKVFKFDDTRCVIDFIKNKEIESSKINNIYLIDYSNNHSLINTNTAYLFKSIELRSPMGGNVAACTNMDSLIFYKNKFNGENASWEELFK